MPGPGSGLHDRMAWLISAVGGQAAAAPIAEVSKDTVNNLRKPGWKVPLDAAINLCRAVGVSLDWLASGQQSRLDLPPGAIQQIDEESGDEFFGQYARLRPLKPERRRVSGKNVELWTPSPLAFDPIWLQKEFGAAPDELRYALVEDDGMAPSIPRHALVLVDATPQIVPRSGDYLVELGEELLARRLNRRPDGTSELVAEADLTWRYEITRPNPTLYRIRWCARAIFPPGPSRTPHRLDAFADDKI